MMKSTLFVADLDNTLFCSRNYPHDGFFCMEHIHGEEQAYMSPEVRDALCSINQKTVFVPLTSRSIEQYLRIEWPEGCLPEYAVVDDGATLLHDGAVDSAWQTESEQMIAPAREEMSRLLSKYSDSEDFIRCRLVDNVYLFVYCAKHISPKEIAEEIRKETSLSVIASGKKIYILPNGIHKGSGMKRLKNLFPGLKTIGAGDSDMDLPMLREAAFTVLPEALAKNAPDLSDAAVCGSNLYFPAFVCRTVLNSL